MWFQLHPWVLPIIIGSIGLLYLINNIAAIISSRKMQREGIDHHISGIPFLGGIHLLIAGLISPIKWLGFLSLLDYSFWSFLYALLIGDRFRKGVTVDYDNQQIKEYSYLQDGFEAVLYDAGNDDDRLIIVIQGLKGLELPKMYAYLFSERGYSTLAMSYYGGKGQKKGMRAIPLEQFQAACDEMKKCGYKRIGIYGNSKGGGMALLAASVVPDISLVIAASAFGHIMQGTGRASEDPCKAMVSYRGNDFPYIEKGKLMSDFLKRCIRERNIRLLYFFDEWDKKGTEENEIPVENIHGDILLLTATHDESVPAKRDAELLCKRLERKQFKHNYRHINSEIGSHNLGYFPVNNDVLRREKIYPEECQRAREETLNIIIETLEAWKV